MTLPSPSSTVMLLRDNQDSSLEALLVRRNPELKTGGGAWVFPGGRVDPLDYSKTDPHNHFLAAQNAAVRETLEETAIELSRHELTPFAHWTTPLGRSRRFATWFFLAHAGEPSEITVDGEEIVDYRWVTPQAALEAQRVGDIDVMIPTFVCLNWLKNFESLVAAVTSFQDREVQHFNPVPITTETGQIMLYDDDAGYQSSNPDAPGRRHRVVIEGNEWNYENSEW